METHGNTKILASSHLRIKDIGIVDGIDNKLDNKLDNRIVDETTLLYLNVMTVMSSHIPDMIKDLSTDELCRVRNRKGNGSQIAVAEINRRYPALKKLTNDTIRIAVKDYIKNKKSSILNWGPIEYWDVSSVTDMRNMFSYCYNLTADLSKWDVSEVTDMSCIFKFCEVFNSDLSEWDVSSVTDMSGMFRNSVKFNGDISRWDVSSVKEMYLMFYYCDSFNSDVSRWDVSSVTKMSDMFCSCSKFNSDLSKWDVSSVTDMTSMFKNSSSQTIFK